MPRASEIRQALVPLPAPHLRVQPGQLRLESQIRRKLTGHKTASVRDLSTQLERETLRAAVHAIPSLPEL